MGDLGKWLVLAGALIAALGAVIWLFPHVPWLGRLPGDVVIERGSVRVWFPIVSCLVVSVVLSLLLHLFSRLR